MWILVFYLLLVQLAVTGILILPIPAWVKTPVIKAVFKGRNVILAIVILTSVLAFQAYMGFSHHYSFDKIKESQTSHAAGAATYHTMLEKYHRAQRNFYLSVFALSLSIILWRLANILNDQLRLEGDIHRLADELSRVKGAPVTQIKSSGASASPAPVAATGASSKKQD